MRVEKEEREESKGRIGCQSRAIKNRAKAEIRLTFIVGVIASAGKGSTVMKMLSWSCS